MLLIKLTQYGTVAQIVINFQDVQALLEGVDGTQIVMHDFKFHVNESIDMITSTIEDMFSADDSYRQN